MFFKIKILERYLLVFPSKVVIFVSKSPSSLCGAFEVEPIPHLYVLEYVVHDYEKFFEFSALKFPFDLMHPIYPIDQTLGMSNHVLIVTRKHLFKFSEFSLMDRLDEVLLVLCVVEKGP